ncbi:response regulator transcription factor [Sulfurivirga sp.]|uniref:response regulator transcription factor n=1 Tax=Sulfurivirga sp. TaxID=2614236 RepID=UPI0025F322ED|nr:response regulator transcription factor [Sulfurivirga sp.]
MRLLLIEDEPDIAAHLRQRFEAQGYEVITATDGDDGLWHWREQDFDLVLLDLGLPGTDGLTLLRTRRAESDTTPVLILTARNAWQERVEGLQAGADDYLGKPFHFEELRARVTALLRRLGHSDDGQTLRAGDLTLYLDRREVEVDGHLHTLTAAEFALLRALMRRPGQVVDKLALLEAITDDPDARDTNMVEVYVRRLRKLIGPERIQTLRGQGYRLTETDNGR